VGFNNSDIDSFLSTAVDSVSLKGSIKLLGAGGTILWGMHTETSKPTTWVDANVDQNLETTDGTGFGRHSVFFDTTVLDDWIAGTYKGMSFGPAPGTSSGYEIHGYGNGAGDDADEPWLEFTVTKWKA
jgi:hypothetical protein